MPIPSWLPDTDEPIDLASVDYYERQAIVVVTEPEAQEIRVLLRQVAADDEKGWLAGLKRAGKRSPEDAAIEAMSLAGADVVPDRILSGLLRLGPAAARFRQVLKTWRQTSVGLIAVSGTEARQLEWPKGNPGRNELYIGSPVDYSPLVYYPASSFHDDILFERYGELRELLSRLGASTVIARALHGKELGGTLEADSPLPEGVGSVESKAEAVAARRAEREDLLELVPGPPVPPEQLADGLGWFSREKDWQRLARRRYADRARRIEIRFRHTNDFGLDARFAAALNALPKLSKIKLGGDYKHHEDTLWEVEARFESFTAARSDAGPSHLAAAPDIQPPRSAR